MRSEFGRRLVLVLLLSGGFARMERFTPLRVGLVAGCLLTSVALFRIGRPRLRAIASGIPALTLCAMAFDYALHPAPNSPRFALALFAAALLALVLSVFPLGAHRRWARRATLVLVVLLAGDLSLLAGEVVAESIYPRTPHGILAVAGSATDRPYVPDEELIHRPAARFRGRFTHPEYRGEAFETNSEGFRDAEWPDPMPEGESRILVLGDSMVLGFGVAHHETIPVLLEGKLRARVPERALRVLNAGVPGYGTRQEAVLLGRLLARARPTHVVVFFYDGNDLEETRQHFVHARLAGAHGEFLPSEKREEARPARPDRAQFAWDVPTLFDLGYWFRYSTLCRRIDLWIGRRLVRSGLRPPDFAFGYAIVAWMRRAPDPETLEEFELTGAALREMERSCRSAGSRLFLVRLPSRVQTEPATFERLLADLRKDPALYDRRMPGQAVVEDCRSAGIPALDLFSILETLEAGPNPAFFVEGHTNRVGNRRIAGELAGFLAESGFPGDAPGREGSERGR